MIRNIRDFFAFYAQTIAQGWGVYRRAGRPTYRCECGATFSGRVEALWHERRTHGRGSEQTRLGVE